MSGETHREPFVMRLIELELAGSTKDGLELTRIVLNRNLETDKADPRAATATLLVPLDEALSFYRVGDYFELALIPTSAPEAPPSTPQEAAT